MFFPEIWYTYGDYDPKPWYLSEKSARELVESSDPLLNVFFYEWLPTADKVSVWQFVDRDDAAVLCHSDRLDEETIQWLAENKPEKIYFFAELGQSELV